MRKKILITLLCGLMAFGVTGCGEEDTDTSVNFKVENTDGLSDTSFGISNLIEIKNGLYYDKTTLIVYFWNGRELGRSATTPSPYYAPNGLAYRYDPKTHTFMEIKGE